LKGEVGSCRPRGLPKGAGAGEGAGGIRKQKEKARPSLTVEDFKNENQSMVADKEMGRQVRFQWQQIFLVGCLTSNGSQRQEEEANEISALCY
jgi:hypothetical protein